jgi:acyl-CoA synthetase (AMP-forming)/AMP-acid ligase II
VAEWWNYADVYEAVAAKVPARPLPGAGRSHHHLGVTSTVAPTRSPPICWRPGSRHQGKVAAYLYNCAGVPRDLLAAFKAALAPVNTNYRYETDELAVPVRQRRRRGIVFHAGFAPKLEACASV